MAFTSILRKSANSLAPLAIRLTRVQRNYHSCIATALNHVCQSQKPAVNRFYPNTLHFSTAVDTRKANSDDNLLRVLESEIQCAEEESDEIDQVGAPGGFPFDIEDTPGLQTITLKREYDGELIKVEVHMPDLVTGMDESEDKEDNDEEYEKPDKSSLPLVVMITKKDGPSLEFSCTAMPDEISIDSLAIKYQESEDMLAYEGPDFQDLDENLQKAFHKYLEIRGIKPSTTNFLHEYMINKDNKEYTRWLKNLKNFVES
ncbi:Mitochondrial glycoprotein [Corchorus olitorius]|uniref:Mitochondrial glycoprotein n=1 Tax=Corchorus olitorius TaxID=93759 RepID=A0A1R3I224_9ROSI|nr:Mitochondrial glycoprotein [Corchorus olitorius]